MLKYFKRLGDNRRLSLSQLRDKTIVLLRIERIARSSDVASIPFDTVNPLKDGYSFRYLSSKENRDRSLSPLQVVHFSLPKVISAAYALHDYLARTSPFRDELSESNNRLFLSLDGKSSLSATSVANCCLRVMKEAKVPSRFRAATLRHAAACAAIRAGVSIDEILKIGRWRSREVFEKFYWVSTAESGNIIAKINSNIQR